MYQEKQLSQPLTLSEPVQFHYLARGRMYVKLGLPTDATYQIGCYGETFKAYTGFPMPQVTGYLDRVTLKTAKLYIKGGEVVDHDHQQRLPYTWVCWPAIVARQMTVHRAPIVYIYCMPC